MSQCVPPSKNANARAAGQAIQCSHEHPRQTEHSLKTSQRACSHGQILKSADDARPNPTPLGSKPKKHGHASTLHVRGARIRLSGEHPVPVPLCLLRRHIDHIAIRARKVSAAHRTIPNLLALVAKPHGPVSAVRASPASHCQRAAPSTRPSLIPIAVGTVIGLLSLARSQLGQALLRPHVPW